MFFWVKISLLTCIALGIATISRAGLSNPGAAGEEMSIDSLIVSITHANEQLSYSGQFVQRRFHAGKPLQMQVEIQHWAPNRTLLRFLQPDELQGTVIAISGDQFKVTGVKHIVRGLRFGAPSQWLKGQKIFREIRLLKQNYRIRAQNGGEFLGRSTLLLSILPNYPNRPELKLWVDRQSHLILKMQRLSPIRGASETNEFTRLVLQPPDTSQFRRVWASMDSVHTFKRRGWRKKQIETYKDLAEFFAAHNQTVLIPETIPAGFALREIRRLSRRHRTFLHFLYGDGLVYISLFQHRSEGKMATRHHRDKKNRRQPPFTIVRGSRDKIQYSLMGEIPQQELQSMAQSLIPIKKTGNSWSAYFIPALITIFVIAGIYYWRRREAFRG
ncbi:MAG: hypothetical protein D6814_12560 [Calditrichaeota bacterium]|nr:MAG: hypothetical protein D6814_12560 [Calditrichota bacterium]